MAKSIQQLIETFGTNTGLPSDEEMEALGVLWEQYIKKSDPIRALHCKKDIMMGMIIMGKRWIHNNKEKS